MCCPVCRVRITSFHSHDRIDSDTNHMPRKEVGLRSKAATLKLLLQDLQKEWTGALTELCSNGELDAA